MLFEFPRPADAHAAISAFGPPPILLDACDDRVRAEVADGVGVPLPRHAVRRAVIASDAAGIGRRNAHPVESGSDPLAALAGRPPLEHHAPDCDLLFVVRQETDVVAGATNVLTILEPIHELVIRTHESSTEAVGRAAARAQPSSGHALLHKHDAVAEPRRESAVLLILDQTPDQVCHLVGFEFFRCDDLVMGDEGHAAGDQLLLERHHLE